MLKDKIILVAGAGGLIGKAIVEGIIKSGGAVIAADISLDKLSGLGNESDFLTFVEIDLTNESQVKEFFEQDVQLNGAVNASYPRNEEYGNHFFDVRLSSFNQNVSFLLGTTFLFSQQCGAHFLRTKQEFSLINLSSIYGVVAPRFRIYENTKMTTPVEYSVSKSAILHLNKYISRYISDSRFRVNSVSPGGIYDSQPEEFLKAYKNETMGQGLLNALDIVGSVIFLLSDQSKYVTGQNIIVDDGFYL